MKKNRENQAEAKGIYIVHDIYVCVVVYVISYIRYTRIDWHVE